MYFLRMKSKDVIKILEKHGWIKDRQSGSHIIFKHVDFAHHITIPQPKNESSIGVIKQAERISGLKIRKD